MLISLIYITFALAAVLLLRQPVRRVFGAGPAFTLWVLPLVLGLLPWLPATPSSWTAIPALRVLPDVSDVVLRAESISFASHWPLLLWLCGALPCLAGLALHYSKLLKQSQRLPRSMLRTLLKDQPDLDPRWVRLHQAGPAVLWAPRSRILLPHDFFERFDATQRRLILQHERSHLQRGDALWSLLGDIALALLWFHPLAWLAWPRLRLDQELACDERVLRQSPRDRVKYAHTLLHSTGTNAVPVLIPWLVQPQLKERISMIQSCRPGTLRRRVGFIALTTLITTGMCVAQAVTKHDHQDAPTAPLSIASQFAPHYPESAIKNHEQGTVVLDVLVGIDGAPLSFKLNPMTQATPDLVKAAGDAVMQWHFNPQVKNGKPTQGTARVPITFSMSPETSDPPAAASSAAPSSSTT